MPLVRIDTVDAFTDAKITALADTGVRVSMIKPGAVQTELNVHITNPDITKASEDNDNSMDSLRAEYIAAAITYVVILFAKSRSERS